MYYLIRETLIPCTGDEVLSGTAPYAAVVTWNEWAEKKSSFNMGSEIDQDLDAPTVPITRALLALDLVICLFSSTASLYENLIKDTAMSCIEAPIT